MCDVLASANGIQSLFYMLALQPGGAFCVWDRLPEPRRKVGRPSKYDSSYCELVVELGRNGKSKAQMAAIFGIARSNVAIWEKELRDISKELKAAGYKNEQGRGYHPESTRRMLEGAHLKTK